MSLNTCALADACWRVDQTLAEIAAVVAQAEATVPDLDRVARLSSVALAALEDVVRPYMAEARDFYHFRAQAGECCTLWHPFVPLAQTFTAYTHRFSAAHGDLMTKHIAITGDLF